MSRKTVGFFGLSAACLLVTVQVIPSVQCAKDLVQEEPYSSEYDNIDVDAILKSDQLRNHAFDCIVGKGECSEAERFIKEKLPEAIFTSCKRCTLKQKANFQKVGHYYVNNEPDKLNEFLASIAQGGQKKSSKKRVPV
ncbi:hypothetical protein QAD02_019405 [Eretmocerus hayati]|uniref:Uncharacterized protein n=1 Tax=Eretmocerus hayati TaxID=131215 RepID=A0ACC2PKM6_9HYME|nr:hypothetical protein QAD02_019405 [Eretmocerus hayati]